MPYHPSTTDRRNGASAPQPSTQRPTSSGHSYQLSAGGQFMHKPLHPSQLHHDAKV
ncbi:hypothetical protein [Lampropedia aestuarii]|uniref:hypothetical protein n=1 Tax=Lampropedia aestuarii TaxID=2562762 RepID=UPI0014561567|nr:hypothetical protein [Lampropedia aestuarii]